MTYIYLIFGFLGFIKGKWFGFITMIMVAFILDKKRYKKLFTPIKKEKEKRRREGALFFYLLGQADTILIKKMKRQVRTEEQETFLMTAIRRYSQHSGFSENDIREWFYSGSKITTEQTRMYIKGVSDRGDIISKYSLFKVVYNYMLLADENLQDCYTNWRLEPFLVDIKKSLGINEKEVDKICISFFLKTGYSYQTGYKGWQREGFYNRTNSFLFGFVDNINLFINSIFGKSNNNYYEKYKKSSTSTGKTSNGANSYNNQYNKANATREIDISSYYKILGLKENVSFSMVKKRRRRLLSKYHPDKRQNLTEVEKKSLEDKVFRINEAFEKIEEYHKDKL